MRFFDRVDAGQQLARKLTRYSSRAVIYGLPRGGVIVAAEVARQIGAPLDLILVRKIGHPMHEEYAIGALAEGGEPVFNEMELVNLDKTWLDAKIKALQKENKRRRDLYFPKRYKPPDTSGKAAVIIDDGIATGLTIVAAIKAIEHKKPSKIIVAVPVAPKDSIEMIKELADEIIVLGDPKHFGGAVGIHYQIFDQTEDSEVINIINDFHD